ncbi:hypothetical protein G3M48_009998 [Beauveria asiatica]|uniref:Glycosyltransferase family 28 N-terminal domain-containing protein n=1 Tax=Beauveria asiatica TaxID=1069075 RepID=A0AAW0RI15_9HYPO
MVLETSIQGQVVACQDNGRIDIDVNSRLFRRLSCLAPPPQPYKHSAEEEHANPEQAPEYTEAGPTSLRLNIVIQVVGSRGDVQPFVALGQELQRHGHRVRLATHNVFAGFVTAAQLEFFPVGGDPAELMAYMVKNPGLIPSLKGLRSGDVQKKRAMVAEMLRGFWSSCIQPDPVTSAPFVADAIIANPPSFSHIHCAQALGVPLHLMFTMPWTSTTRFCHPLANLGNNMHSIPTSAVNYASFLAVEWLTWQGLQDVINDWRKTLDLEPIPFSEGPLLIEKLKIPFTYCWSPSLVPKPDDWPGHIDVCGFFFRDEPNYTPTSELRMFLDKNPTPVYIGFGSIVIDRPDTLTDLIVQAVEATGVSAIISKGWSKLGGEQPPRGNILYLDDCPHEWLFKHVSAVVHHGGAGTTACGLLHGRPTTIVPFFGETLLSQPFWGNMVAASGAGPTPIPANQLNCTNLANAIRFCHTSAATSAAASLAERMKSESGVRRAVASFHANLPLESMRCDVLPNLAASWQCRIDGTQYKLSKAATQVLLSKDHISRREMKRYSPSPIRIYNQRWEPVTAMASSLATTGTGMVTGAANIVVKPLGVLYNKASREKKATTVAAAAAAAAATEENSARNSQDDDIYGRPAAVDLPAAAPLETKQSGRSSMATAVVGSASGVGHFFHSLSKGMLLDLPLAATEGLRNAPKLYGGQVYEREDVVDWKSGGVVAAKTFRHGIVHGFKGLVKEPARGAKQHGAVGAIRGAGIGVLNFGSKVGSGALGVVSYTGDGIYQSVRAASGRGTDKQVKAACWAEGPRALESAMGDGIADISAVLRSFDCESRHQAKQGSSSLTK